MIVVWSHASVESSWVLGEAEEARKQDKLVPIKLDDIRIPPVFTTYHTISCLNPKKKIPKQVLNDLIQAIEHKIKRPPPTPPKFFARLFQHTKLLIFLSFLGLMLFIFFFFVYDYVVKVVNHTPVNLSMIYPNQDPTPFYTYSYALVIGIDKYQNEVKWPHLAASVDNAESIYAFLRDRQSFNVETLFREEATKANILGTLASHAKTLPKNGRLLMVFFGHGHTVKSSGTDMGYLIPYDATTEVNSYISMQDIQDVSDAFRRVKHQLFIIDAKLSDKLMMQPASSASPASNYLAIDTVAQHRARQLLVSNAPPQNREFTTRLEQGLDGGADRNNDCYVDLQELTTYLADGVKSTQSGQLSGHEQGSMAFRAQRLDSPTAEELKAMLAAGTKKLCGLDFSNTKIPLGQYNLEGSDLHDAILDGVNLMNANLNEANLRRAKLRKAKLGNAQLNRADLRDANLQQAQLQGASLIEAKLNRAELIGTKLNGAKLIRAELREVMLLPDADLSQADLSQADLTRADLRGAILRDIDMHNANLDGAKLKNTVFEPNPNSLPDMERLKLAEDLDCMTFQNSHAALKTVRRYFQNNDWYVEEGKIDQAIKRGPRRDGSVSFWQHIKRLILNAKNPC